MFLSLSRKLPVFLLLPETLHSFHRAINHINIMMTKRPCSCDAPKGSPNLDDEEVRSIILHKLALFCTAAFLLVLPTQEGSPQF